MPGIDPSTEPIAFINDCLLNPKTVRTNYPREAIEQIERMRERLHAQLAKLDQAEATIESQVLMI